MERAGTGIERIKNFCKKNGNKVKFDFDNFCFFTIINKKDKMESSEKTTQKTVEKTVEKILNLIKDNPRLTQVELSAKTGLTRRGVEWNLKQLKQKGILKRIGPDKGGYWEIYSR